MSFPHDNLESFISALRKRDLVSDVYVPVNPYLEIAEIHRRVVADKGKALYFHNVSGSPFPVVTNLFGTEERVKLAFGERPLEIFGELARLPHEIFPLTMKKLWERRALLKNLASVGLRYVEKSTGKNRPGKAPVLDNCVSGDVLGKLPALTSWPYDGGAFLTLPLVYTEHPQNGISNLGIYRGQIHSESLLGLHAQIGKGAGYHLSAAREQGVELPVNVVLGGAPSLILSALAPLPENVQEVLLASLLLGRRLKLVREPVSKLPMPAEADFVLSGRIDTNATRLEGPFGDHYGYYSLAHQFPVMKVDRLYYREGAVFPATVVGKPFQEDYYLGNFLQEMVQPIVPLIMPAIKKLWSYGEAGFHALLAAQVSERFERESLVSAFRILGEGQLFLTKFLLLTDGTVDLKNFPALLSHILERVNFETDLYILGHLSMDTLDYSGPRLNRGSKCIMLGIGKPLRSLPETFQEALPPGLKEAHVYTKGCLVVSAERSYRDAPNLGEELLEIEALSKWPMIVLVDDATFAVASNVNFLWSAFIRVDPARDIKARIKGVDYFHPRLAMPIVIDARHKPSFPAEVLPDPLTVELVDRRWLSYFRS